MLYEYRFHYLEKDIIPNLKFNSKIEITRLFENSKKNQTGFKNIENKSSIIKDEIFSSGNSRLLKMKFFLFRKIHQLLKMKLFLFRKIHQLLKMKFFLFRKLSTIKDEIISLQNSSTIKDEIISLQENSSTIKDEIISLQENSSLVKSRFDSLESREHDIRNLVNRIISLEKK